MKRVKRVSPRMIYLIFTKGNAKDIGVCNKLTWLLTCKAFFKRMPATLMTCVLFWDKVPCPNTISNTTTAIM